MINRSDLNFLWLNREGRWSGSSTSGLAISPDGVLQLRSVPLLDGVLAPEIATLAAPDGPAGIAVDRDGTVYFSDPQNNRVLRIDGCDKSTAPVSCAGRMESPRGLLLKPQRAALCIAESGGHQVRMIRTATGQSLEALRPFDTPWTLAGEDGNIYVVDYGNRSVRKFNALGEEQNSFWTTLAASGVLKQPTDVAAGCSRVFIVDQAAHAIVVADLNGNVTSTFGADQLQQPMGMALIGSELYVGDNARRRVLVFDASALTFVGEAVGYQGPVAALAADGAGGLLVHTGSSLSPVRMILDQAFVKQGILWTAPIVAPTGGVKVEWHRLEAVFNDYVDTLPADAHVQFFIHTSSDVTDAPAPPALNADGTSPFADSKWLAQPPDVNDLFIGGCPALYLWIGVWLSGGGLSTASIEQIRVEFDHQTYIANLPAIYQKAGPSRDFLVRLLSLFESFNSETEAAINRLPALFDPKAAPSDYLPWLAGWLALEWQEDWDDTAARKAIASAFQSYGQTGTAVALRRALKADAGVDAVIQEPILNASWWSLPVPQSIPCGETTNGPTVWQQGENSILGFTTMLAPAQAQGAVVGTTAVLDQSHLIADTDFGVPLFGDVAFQFCVQVYRGQMNCASAEDQVRAVIEDQKPAHTSYHLCVLEPRMRVGFQARVGIDAIVSGPPPAIRLGATPDLGGATMLGGQPGGRIGQMQLGINTAMV